MKSMKWWRTKNWNKRVDKLDAAVSLDPEEAETEKSQEAMEKVHEARRILAEVKSKHLKEIRQIDLNTA